MQTNQFILSYHCNYHTGTPAWCGGVIGMYPTRKEAENKIRECIAEDMAREDLRAECERREPNYGTHSYDGSGVDGDCAGYEDIDNEEVFYYISSRD